LRQRDAKAQRNRGGREQREQGKAEKAGEIHPVFSIDYSAAAPGLASRFHVGEARHEPQPC
jgi:hypothetical protein